MMIITYQVELRKLCMIYTLIYAVFGHPVGTSGNNQRSKIKQVLVVGQMRSGSSFIGELFNQHPNSFYMYEPLRALSRTPPKDHASVLRSIKGYPYTDTEVPHIMKNLFECDFSNIPTSVFKDDFMLRSIHGEEFYKCVRRNSSDGILKEQCLTILTERCQQSQIRTIKTVRMVFGTIEKMLQLMPSLKVIYLVRDPRAIIQSRIALQLVNEIDIESESRRLCQRIGQDMLNIDRCQHSRRIKYVQYEKLANSVINQASDIFSFIGKELHGDVKSWLRLNTKHSFDINPFSTSRNSVTSIYKWAATIKQETYEIIEQSCSELISIFGYKPLHQLKF